MFGVAIFIAAAVLVVGAVWAGRKRPKGGFAQRMATAFGGPKPQRRHRQWRLAISFDGEPFVLHLDGNAGSISRSLELDHSISVHAEQRQPAHAAENFGPRPLFPSADDTLQGDEGRPLEGWERDLPEDLVAQMRSLNLELLTFTGSLVSTHRGDLDKESIEKVCRLLNQLARRLGSQSEQERAS